MSKQVVFKREEVKNAVAAGIVVRRLTGDRWAPLQIVASHFGLDWDEVVEASDRLRRPTMIDAHSRPVEKT